MIQTITPDLLLRAYASGVFPMASTRDDPEIHWVDPRRRGVFPLHNFHISRNLSRDIRSDAYTIRTNIDFAGVIAGCAARPDTWINDEISQLYQDLHRGGFAHSLEVWDGDALIGGVYGVALGAAFFGESMFSRRTNASKIALAWLVHRLRAGGFVLFDTQYLTPHLASLGAIEIPRAVYHDQLAKALLAKASFDPPGYCPSAGAVSSGSAGTSSIVGKASSATSQRSTQTS